MSYLRIALSKIAADGSTEQNASVPSAASPPTEDPGLRKTRMDRLRQHAQTEIDSPGASATKPPTSTADGEWMSKMDTLGSSYLDNKQKEMDAYAAQPITKEYAQKMNAARKHRQYVKGIQQAGTDELVKQKITTLPEAKQVGAAAGEKYVEADIKSHSNIIGVGAEERARELEKQRNDYANLSPDEKKQLEDMQATPDISKLTPELQTQLKEEGRKQIGAIKPSWMPESINKMIPESVKGYVAEKWTGQNPYDDKNLTENTAREAARQTSDIATDKMANAGDKTKAEVSRRRQEALTKYGPLALGGLGMIGMLGMMGMGGRGGQQSQQQQPQQLADNSNQWWHHKQWG